MNMLRCAAENCCDTGAWLWALVVAGRDGGEFLNYLQIQLEFGGYQCQTAHSALIANFVRLSAHNYFRIPL